LYSRDNGWRHNGHAAEEIIFFVFSSNCFFLFLKALCSFQFQ
jgi:hypothetical protein